MKDMGVQYLSDGNLQKKLANNSQSNFVSGKMS